MATVTKPIALDETFNTTSSPSQNITDVLKGGLYDIAQAVSGGGGGSSVSWSQIQNTGDKIAEITINGTTTDVYSPSVSSKADNSIIAPVLSSFVATATVKDSGTQFIYNGVLYEITTSVTVGTSFVVGTNVKVADTIVEQIGKWQYYGQTTGNAEITIPNGVTEVLGHTAYASVHTTFHFLPIQGDIIVERTGYYLSATNNLAASFQWIQSTRKANLYGFDSGGTNYLASATTKWYIKY